MSREAITEHELGTSSDVDGNRLGEGGNMNDLKSGLTSIQDQYQRLADLKEKQKTLTFHLSEMTKTLLREVDSLILIPNAALKERCSAAYLVSEAVVVIFDVPREMRSRPLRSFPTDTIVSILEACSPEIERLIREKCRSEAVKVSALERVSGEMLRVMNAFRAGEDSLQVIPGERERRISEPPVATVRRVQRGPNKRGSETATDVDEIILAAVESSLGDLGLAGRDTILGLLESRYGLSFDEIPEHPRGFIDLANEILGPTAKLLEARMVSEIGNACGVRGSTFCEVVSALKGKKFKAEALIVPKQEDAQTDFPLKEMNDSQAKGTETHDSDALLMPAFRADFVFRTKESLNPSD